MLATAVKQMALTAGISGRTLRRGFKAGKFLHRQNADGRSEWLSRQWVASGADGHGS
jgi:hypothetical protein